MCTRRENLRVYHVNQYFDQPLISNTYYRSRDSTIPHYHITLNHMEYVLWIIFGAAVGWIASVIMKTNTQHSVTLNIAIGIIGAVVGGLFMNFVGINMTAGGFNLYSFVVAILGAMVFIGVARAIQRV